jgi:magnesium transporter
MIKFYLKKSGKISLHTQDSIEKLPAKNETLWIDIIFPTSNDFRIIENEYNLEFPTRQESQEIEISSRFWEDEDDITINSFFMITDEKQSFNESITFVLKDNMLITIRYKEFKTFNDCEKKLLSAPNLFLSGYDVFGYILESRIDIDADIIENLSRSVTTLRKHLFADDTETNNEDILELISQFEDTNTMIRDSLIDKQRIISSLLKSPKVPETLLNNLKIMIKDVNSLIEYTKYNFERLDYIHNIFLGLLGIEQSKVVKIFTVVSVIFLPPTLIASIYGMNFKFMPELELPFGYPLSLILMIISAILPLLIFKKKGWL